MRSYVRLVEVSLAVLAIAFVLAPARATAQSAIPKEVLALFDDLSDIDKLRILNPLNLSEAQLGRTVDSLNKRREDFVAKVAAAAVPPIREMAREIKDLRKRLLTGGEVPADFDKRVKKIQDDFVKRRETEEGKALKLLSDELSAIFTATQRDKAISIAKETTKRDGKPTVKGTDDQFFNLYVKGVFMDYAGIVPLLEDMKAARAAPGTDK